MTLGCAEALLAALCWSLCALCFTSASNRVGTLPVNFVRLVMALPMLVAWHWITTGSLLPPSAPMHTWVFLGLSGLVGFLLGDMCLIRSFMLIGPRRSLLVMTLWPALAALAGWLILGERLTPMAIAGIAITMAGIVWVELESGSDSPGIVRAERVKGIVFSVLGALGQASGFVLSKAGMQLHDPVTGLASDYNAVAANIIRASAALAGFVVVNAALRRWGTVAASVRHGHAMLFTAVGAMLGPFIGVVLALRALQHAPVGIASVLISTSPVMIVPFSMLFYRERVTLRAVLGACVVVGGVCLLFMQPK